MVSPINVQYDQVQADIDAMGGPTGEAAAGGPLLPLPGMQQQQQQQQPPQDPAAMMQLMMQMMMETLRAAFQQAVPGAQNTGAPPVAFSHQGGSHWRHDTHMAWRISV